MELPVRACAVQKFEIEYPAQAMGSTLRISVTRDDGEILMDRTLFRVLDDGSPVKHYSALPLGRFTLRAETSKGLVATAELNVEELGLAAETLRLTLR